MTPKLTYEMFGLKHVGHKRNTNEDSFYYRAARPEVMVVADGMGGHAGGDVASKLTVDVIREFFTLTLQRRKYDYPETLADVIKQANRDIRDEAVLNPKLKGMGSTVVMAAPYSVVENGDFNNYMTIAHMGDSRCYGLRGSVFRALTKDHSDGAHQLSRAVGHCPLYARAAEINTVRVKVGDVFMLCSDGLNKMVKDVDIASVLMSDDNINTKVEKLIQKALDNGGADNVTVIIAIAKDPTMGESFC